MTSSQSVSGAVPLARGAERLAVWALALGAFVVAVNVNLIGSLRPFVLADPLYGALGELERQHAVDQLLWTTSAAGAVGSLLLGPAVDRLGRRGPILAGTLLFTLASASYGWAPDHATLVALRVVSGLGGGVLFTCASAAVADLVPFERRGVAMGVFSTGLFLATPVGLPIGIELAKTGGAGWRQAFVWLVVPAALALLGFLTALPAGLGRSGQRTHQLEVLRQPDVVPALLSVLVYTGAFFTSVSYAASWMDDSGLLPKDEQTLVWVVLGFSTAFGSLLLPRLADRIGKRSMVMATTAGVAVCLLALAGVRDMVGLWLVGLPMTFLAAARTPALQALMSEIVEPRMRGTLMGLRAAAVNLGAFLFLGIGGRVYSAHGYPTLLCVAAAALAVAYLLVRQLKVRL